MTSDGPRRNLRPLSLHVPEPKYRPGDVVEFGHTQLPPAGAAPRPAIDAAPSAMRDLAYSLVRVLDEDGNAVGPWDPKLPAERLAAMLRAMMLTRAYDERMYRAQRQGKTSFYMKCSGEEAVAAATCACPPLASRVC